MAKISIGNFILPHNPSKMTMVHAQRHTAKAKTLNTIAFYSWGTMVNGLEIVMNWPFMKSSTFATLDGLIMADSPATFNPQDGSGSIYNIELEKLDGDYHIGLSSGITYRKNVKLTLTILNKA